MTTRCIYELNCDHDKFPGFIQVFKKTSPDQKSWEEDIGIQSLMINPKEFDNKYFPVKLQLNIERQRKKYSVGDISSWMKPFIIFSDKARQVLSCFLSPAGQFLEVDAPLPGFIGFHPQVRLQGCINLEKSVCTKYSNGSLVVRKPAMYEEKVRGHDIFAVEEIPTGLYVSAAFKAAVDAAKLKGFDFSREVPLV